MNDTAAPRLRVSYAQSGEDVRVWRTLRHLDDVFYAEVGASDPVVDSLTAALSEAGWRGLLVEPEPDIAEAARRARPRDVVVAAAASSRPGVLTFTYADKRGQGQVAPVDEAGSQGTTKTVPAVRLADVLDTLAPPQVHFMSIDVEGHEKQALEGLDLARWRPWILCLESTEPDSRTPSWMEWEPLLLDAGYRFVTFDGVNRWYVSPEHHDLAEALAEPYSALDEIIDGWRRRDWVEQRRVVEALEGDKANLLSVAESRAERVSQLERRLEEAAADHLRAQGELRQSLEAALADVRRLEREVLLITQERDLATARERVVLDSKSWRVTAPLRTARWRAGLALSQRAGSAVALPGAHDAPDTQVAPPASEGDVRRRRALQARIVAARSGGSGA